MSKKLTKIMSVILALVMMCSLLPMSALAAENDTYTVTFAPGNLCVYNGEGAYPTSDYDDTTGEFLLPNPADIYLTGRMENLVFAGWTLEGGDGTVYAIGENVAHLITSNVTFLANFEEQSGPDTVTYTVDPGEIKNTTTNFARVNGPIPAQYLGVISLPASDELIHSEYGWVIPDGLTFLRWDKNNGEAIPTEGERTISFMPEDGDVYTAIWKTGTVATYTVTLHPGTAGGQAVSGEDILDGTFEAGTLYQGPAEVPYTHIGYHTIGWSYTAGGEVVSFPITVNSNIDLYAVWEADIVRDYWIVTLHAGTDAAFQEEVPGYEYVSGDLLGEAEKAITYNIALPSVYDLNVDGENATFKTLPAGMEFAGWRLDTSDPDAEEVTYYSGELITVTEDISLTAQWRPAGEGPYNLIFSAGLLGTYTEGGVTGYNRNFRMEIPAGGSYVLPATIEEIKSTLGWTIPEGYIFDGWENLSIQDEDDRAITEVTDMSHDYTVTARWQNESENVWTITFDANGGTGTMEPVTVRTELSVYAYVLPTCNFTAPSGMEFAYWTVSGFGGEYQPEEAVNITSDVTVTAHWRTLGEYYFVAFNPNGGSGRMDSVLLETPSFGEIAYYDVPECEFTAPAGMIFSHWVVEGTDEEYYPGDTMEVTTNVVLVAQWVIIEDTDQSFFG